MKKDVRIVMDDDLETPIVSNQSKSNRTVADIPDSMLVKIARGKRFENKRRDFPRYTRN
jgi:hypothetical protein